MDIVCARTGKHFSSVEAARECGRHCKSCNLTEDITLTRVKHKDKSYKNLKFVPSQESKLSSKEWEDLMLLLNHPSTPHSIEPVKQNNLKNHEIVPRSDSIENDISQIKQSEQNVNIENIKDRKTEPELRNEPEKVSLNKMADKSTKRDIPSKKRTSKSAIAWVWILTICVIAAVIGVVTYGYNHQNDFNSETIKPTPIDSPNEFAQFKYGTGLFTLEYPVDWTVTDSGARENEYYAIFKGCLKESDTECELSIVFYEKTPDSELVWQKLQDESTGLIQSGEIDLGTALKGYQLIESTNDTFKRTLVLSKFGGVVTCTRTVPKYVLTPEQFTVLDGYSLQVISTFKFYNNILTSTPESTPVPSILPTPVSTPNIPYITTFTATTFDYSKGTYQNYYLGLVDSPEGTLGGNGCYDDAGGFIILINNKNATDPTYGQLINFLRNNTTDQYHYQYTTPVLMPYYGTAESHVDLTNIQNIIDGKAKPSNPDICADFAERLHNEAEMAGIRCAYVSLDMIGYSDPYSLGIASDAGHACNAFQTTDKGLIYIDATGWVSNIPHPSRAMSSVNIIVGQQYSPISLFPEEGWQSANESMGTVTNIFLTWDGNWND